MSIEHFQEVRSDGRIIEAWTTSEQIHAWGIQKVVELRWRHEGREVVFKSRYGVFGRVLAHREGVAATENTDSTGRRCRLLILNADGSVRHEVSRVQMIQGHRIEGEYAWFETKPGQPDHVLGVMLEANDGAMYWLQIDTNTGQMLEGHWVKV